jgi:cytochrome c-type biogenesis protein CcmH
MSKRLLQSVAIAVCSLVFLAASNFDKLGHELVCQCGCGQILLECNHVGCPVSPVMIKELQQQMATGLGDTGVLNWFSAKYGPIVLAAPIRGGFDTAAWVVPFAVLGLGIALVIVLMRRWKRPAAAAGPAIPETGDPVRERIRKETTWE